MLDNYTLKVPAKINLFLKILNKRKDGFHNIRSGVTFINLYDKINISKKENMNIVYYGKFKPNKNFYTDCIIQKTLKYLELNSDVNFEINIEKNIPTQAGLGSASTNAAGLIKCLIKMNLIEMKNNKFYSQIGSDIPVCLFGKNSIITGIGEQVKQTTFPKYYILLVKPNINLSTKNMYNKITNNIRFNYNTKDQDKVNDFEKIAIVDNDEIKKILTSLSNSEDVIFARMTGSGSCCYAVYSKIEYAEKAKRKFNEDFPDLWTFVGENNI